ncbi:hypothetical protein ACEOWJ_003242 [Bacillus cereus]
MDKNIELQEVKELQSRFQASTNELNQHLESLTQKIGEFTEINSFQGKTADGIKEHIFTVHGGIVSAFMVIADGLNLQFQKAIEDFNSSVDSDADAKIYGSYLDEVKKKVNGYSEAFNHSNEEAQQTVGTVSDIVAIQYPSSSGITEGAVNSQKEISDTLEKLEAYNSQQQDLQDFDGMMRELDDGMNRVQANGGDFSIGAAEKILPEGWFAGIVASLKKTAGWTGKGKKLVMSFFSVALRMGYMERILGFRSEFDINALEGQGAHILKTLKQSDMVKILKLLTVDENEDAIIKFIFQDKFKIDYGEVTRTAIAQAKKDIYKLPEFEALQDFRMTSAEEGVLKTLGDKWKGSFKTEFLKNFTDLNYKKWPETFKDLKTTGTIFKSVAIAGTALTVVDNVVKSQANGFQLQDVRDVVLDTGVDFAFAAGATATGAVIGTALGPLGTVAGAAIGTAVGVVGSILVNTKSDMLGGESVVSGTKKLVKWGADFYDNVRVGNYKEVMKMANSTVDNGKAALKKLKSIFW